MKTHLNKVYASILLAGLTVSTAMAQTGDPLDAAQAKLGTGVTAAGVLGASVAALFAGIWVYSIVKKGGSKLAK